MKRIIACLMAGVMLLALVGCGASGSSGSASSAAKKDYTQILHDARSDEDNEYEMIFTKGDGDEPADHCCFHSRPYQPNANASYPNNDGLRKQIQRDIHARYSQM